jgi:hypothetical protein
VAEVANFRPFATWFGQYGWTIFLRFWKTAIRVNFQYSEGLEGMAIRDLTADFLHWAIF